MQEGAKTGVEVAELCHKKLDGKSLMKPQKSLKGALTNLDLNHMLLIVLYSFLEVVLSLSSEESHWQPAGRVEKNVGYGMRKH